MQQSTGSIAGFYRAQVESAQDLTSASMEGFERIQQLALQAWRQQIDNQFRLVNAVASRSAEAVVDPEIARPAFDRMIDVQRQLADTIVSTNQRMLSAVGGSAQRGVEHGAALTSGAGSNSFDTDGYATMMQTAFQQWQELTSRMLDVFQQQFSNASGEIQRQGQRAVDQTSQAVQHSLRAQAGSAAEQSAATTGSAGQNQGNRSGKNPERKHEIA